MFFFLLHTLGYNIEFGCPVQQTVATLKLGHNRQKYVGIFLPLKLWRASSVLFGEPTPYFSVYIW